MTTKFNYLKILIVVLNIIYIGCSTGISKEVTKNEIAVPAGKNSLRTSVIVSFLLPEINNDTNFKKRLGILLGEKNTNVINRESFAKNILDIKYLQGDEFKKILRLFKENHIRRKESKSEEIQDLCNELNFEIQVFSDSKLSKIYKPISVEEDSYHVVNPPSYKINIISDKPDNIENQTSNNNNISEHYRVSKPKIYNQYLQEMNINKKSSKDIEEKEEEKSSDQHRNVLDANKFWEYAKELNKEKLVLPKKDKIAYLLIGNDKLKDGLSNKEMNEKKIRLPQCYDINEQVTLIDIPILNLGNIKPKDKDWTQEVVNMLGVKFYLNALKENKIKISGILSVINDSNDLWSNKLNFMDYLIHLNNNIINFLEILDNTFWFVKDKKESFKNKLSEIKSKRENSLKDSSFYMKGKYFAEVILSNRLLELGNIYNLKDLKDDISGKIKKQKENKKNTFVLDLNFSNFDFDCLGEITKICCSIESYVRQIPLCLLQELNKKKAVDELYAFYSEFYKDLINNKDEEIASFVWESILLDIESEIANYNDEIKKFKKKVKIFDSISVKRIEHKKISKFITPTGCNIVYNDLPYLEIRHKITGIDHDCFKYTIIENDSGSGYYKAQLKIEEKNVSRIEKSDVCSSNKLKVSIIGGVVLWYGATTTPTIFILGASFVGCYGYYKYRNDPNILENLKSKFFKSNDVDNIIKNVPTLTIEVCTKDRYILESRYLKEWYNNKIKETQKHADKLISLKNKLKDSFSNSGQQNENILNICNYYQQINQSLEKKIEEKRQFLEKNIEAIKFIKKIYSVLTRSDKTNPFDSFFRDYEKLNKII